LVPGLSRYDLIHEHGQRWDSETTSGTAAGTRPSASPAAATATNHGRDKRAMSDGPLTMQQLIERWHIDGPSDEAKRKAFYRRADLWGLKAMAGTRGHKALFRAADVDRAEERAAKGGGR